MGAENPERPRQNLPVTGNIKENQGLTTLARRLLIE